MNPLLLIIGPSLQMAAKNDPKGFAEGMAYVIYSIPFFLIFWLGIVILRRIKAARRGNSKT